MVDFTPMMSPLPHPVSPSRPAPASRHTSPSRPAQISRRSPTDHPASALAVPRSPGQTFSRLLGLLGFVCVLGLVACSPPGVPEEEVDKQEIQVFLEGYLPKVGQAYAQQDASVLEGVAVPKEQARIELRTEELSAAGQVYVPEFREVTVEDVSVWNYSNAFVTTLEVWDVRALAQGTERLITESLGQRSRVKYQLKRKDDSWVVLFRELEQVFES